nr:hypothetical protein [Escherichia coli]
MSKFFCSLISCLMVCQMATQFFSNLTYTFSQPITALIGRNGVGKKLIGTNHGGAIIANGRLMYQ